MTRNIPDRAWTRAAVLIFIALTGYTLFPDPVAPQSADGEPPWTAAVHYSALQVAPTPEAAFWHTLVGSVRREIPTGSVALEAIGSRRFETTDGALAVDGYTDLYPGAYAHLRGQVAPGAQALPRVDLLAELFHALGPAELHGSVRHQRFEEVRVTAPAVGLGWYRGRWYLRQQTLAARIGDDWSPFARVSARRYLGSGSDTYVEASAGGGEEVLEAEPTEGSSAVRVITSGAWFGAVTGRIALSPRLAMTGALSYSSYERIPARLGLSIGVLHRW